MGRVASISKQERPPPDPLIAALPGLRRAARRLARTPDLAEDLVQDTMARYLGERRERGRAAPVIQNLSAYLRRILLHLFIDHLRKEARAEMRPLCEVQPLGVPPAALTRLFAKEVIAALADMPPAQAETLLRYAWGGESYAEIAMATGLKQGTVMSRIARARAALRKALGESAKSPSGAPFS